MASANDGIKAECDPDGDYPMRGRGGLTGEGEQPHKEAEVSGLTKEGLNSQIKLEVGAGNGFLTEDGPGERERPSLETGAEAAVKKEVAEGSFDVVVPAAKHDSLLTLPLLPEGGGEATVAEREASSNTAARRGQYHTSLTLPLLSEEDDEDEEEEGREVIEIDDDQEEEEDEEEEEPDEVVLVRVNKKRAAKVSIVKEELAEMSPIDVDKPSLNKNSFILRPTEEAPSEPSAHTWLNSALNGVAYVTSSNNHLAVIHPVQLSAQVAPAIGLNDLKFSWRYLYRNVLVNEETCIRWLASFQLLPNERTCPLCESQMVVARHWTCWRCRHCKKGFSVRKDSLFNGEQLPLTTIMEIIYWWSLDFNPKLVCRELELDSQTVVLWFHRLKKICERYFQDHPRTLGGPGKEVEITDSSFNGQWVLGIVERGTNDAYFSAVLDRSSETLLPIIERHVLPGSRIITDGWRSYTELPNHAAVNRSLHFVDPEDRSVHTNTIEGLWRHVKDDLLRRKKGLRRESLDSNLREIQWRKLMGEATFAEMLYWLDFYRVRCKE